MTESDQPFVRGAHHDTVGQEVMRIWSARVANDIPAVASRGAMLATFIPVLFDHIAEIISPGISRPFGTDRSSALSDLLANDGRMDFHADDVVGELQTFRSVLFSVARTRALPLSESQYEQIGELIDATVRGAVMHCAAVERAMRELVAAEFSHDLRNPLNTANALAQLIERCPDNDKVGQMAGRISQKIAETDALIKSHMNALLRHSASG